LSQIKSPRGLGARGQQSGQDQRWTQQAEGMPAKRKTKRSSESVSRSQTEKPMGKHPERLVHSESSGFDIDSYHMSDTGPSRSGSGIGIGDEAPHNVYESPNGEDLTELVALQRQLMTIRDPAVLVKVVMLIKKLGKFSVGSSTFDFDLCTLDSTTIQQIRSYLSQ